eukprot:CAMPEP_0113538752 /NCGR_PEP_ID=MMETSP0015_2-20120614/7539_1 /TAXON_ID=2838 /ORGANISM="Odontella" /LENGTH=152 /DNA_ID=CAMNT_0000438359 /DNA_START=452 /DNA_END=910 /DNA_ORIENTATION=+ /assembly_acc=CAM_ASM_000160
MVQISDSLAWQLVQGNTSFMKKVNGRTKRSGCVKFSVERGNVKSLSTYKYSGIANSRAADVSCTDENRAVLTTKTASKCATQPKKGSVTVPLNKHFAKTDKTIRSQVQTNFYRPDLTQDVLAKYSVCYRANRIAKGVTKPIPVKKGRGTKKN